MVPKGHYSRPGLGRPERRAPRARGDIEDALAGGEPARLHQHRPEVPDRRLREAVVVAKRPRLPSGGLATERIWLFS